MSENRLHQDRALLTSYRGTCLVLCLPYLSLFLRSLKQRLQLETNREQSFRLSLSCRRILLHFFADAWCLSVCLSFSACSLRLDYSRDCVAPRGERHSVTAGLFSLPSLKVSLFLGRLYTSRSARPPSAGLLQGGFVPSGASERASGDCASGMSPSLWRQLGNARNSAGIFY